MVVRVVYLFVCTLLIFGKAFAEGDCLPSGSAHTCPGGQFWDGSFCVDCEEGHYCTGDGLEKCCPTNFPNSTAGTEYEDNCYRPCSADSDDPDYTTTHCGETKYIAQWGDNTHVNCINENGQMNAWTFTNDYHLESGMGCYLNTRPCEDFEFDPATDFEWTTFVDQITSTGVEISGTAHWIEDANQYDTSECSMIASFRDERSVMQCNTKRLCPTATYNVPSASTHIQYNNGLTSNPAYYYCESCLSAGYYPTTDKPTGQQHHLPTCNNPTTGEYTACSCVQIHKGYYGDCQNAWASTMPLSQCQPRECPFGETTNGPGSIGSESCRFGGSTQICDDAGCINLNDVGDLSLGDWQMLP